MKKIAAMLALILAISAIPCAIAAEEFREADCSVAAGYYVSPVDGVLLLADGTMRTISTDDSGEEADGTYKLLSDGERFIIETSYGARLCFVPQPEKGKTETGGVYYADYNNFIGTAGQGFDEGSQVQFGDFVFDNDYTVVVREPLSVFFGVDGSGYGKIEGPGYDTPEEAATAYIRAFQKNDLDGMLSTFAVETFAERYDLAKQIERLHAYHIGLGVIPNISDYSNALNVESRRSQIVDLIRHQYFTLTGAACADGKSIQKDADATGAEFLAENFAADDSPWLAEIDFQGDFLEPQALTELYYNETNQNNIARLIACYGGDEGRSLAARLAIAGKPYVQFMDVIRYGDRWYNLTLGGNLANLLGLSTYSGGLSPYPIPED